MAIDRSDVASIDGIIAAFYECAVDVEAWQHDRAAHLFAPHARFIPIEHDHGGETRVAHYDFATYRKRILSGNDSLLETEVDRHTQFFGSIGHVISTFEGRQRDSLTALTLGINSMQLVWREARWWIVSVMSERVPTCVDPG